MKRKLKKKEKTATKQNKPQKVEKRVCLASFDVAMVTNFDFKTTFICSLVKALQTCTKSFSLTLLVWL